VQLAKAQRNNFVSCREVRTLFRTPVILLNSLRHAELLIENVTAEMK